MCAHLCSDSDYFLLYYTFYGLILGKQNSVELPLYSAAQSFPIPAMRRKMRRWRPTGRYKKPKFTRNVSLPPRAAKMPVAVFVLNIGGKIFPSHCQFTVRSDG
jgi:hypothetical protein